MVIFIIFGFFGIKIVEYPLQERFFAVSDNIRLRNILIGSSGIRGTAGPRRRYNLFAVSQRDGGSARGTKSCVVIYLTAALGTIGHNEPPKDCLPDEQVF